MTERPVPGDEPSLPDDVWEQFKQDSEGAIRASAPKEPSARARMVTERLRQQEAAGIRPEGWRADPVGRVRKRRRWVAPVGFLVAIGALLVALNPSKALDLVDGSNGAESATPSASPLAAETVRPSSAPTETFPGTPTVDAPFAGSPALTYADGEAGIVLPKARAAGGLSQERVEFALRKTKEFLVHANLDPRTLRGERPESALSLIEPRQTDLHTRLATSLSTPDKEHDPLAMFSRFDPQETRLVGDVVKTHGRMTFTADKKGGVDVHADYTFVYPLVKAADGSDEVARTVVRRILDVQLADPERFLVTPGKLQILKYQEDAGNSACDVYDGYLHPHFRSDAQTGSAPSGETVDPYDRSRDLDSERSKECGTVSRT